MVHVESNPAWNRQAVLEDIAKLKAINTSQDAELVDFASRLAAVESQAPGGPVGTVGLDTFAGVTDDDKLTTALTFLASLTHKPTLVLPRGRDTTFTQPGRKPFSGLRIDGGAPAGPLNMEIGSTLPYRIHVNTTGPWWDSTGVDVQSVWFGHFARHHGAGSFFWRNNYATGQKSPYPIEFEHHAQFGGAGGFGTYAEKCVMTQAVFSGHWATMGFTDTPYHLGGSDMDLWPAGMHNIESQQAGNSKPIVWLDYLSNSGIGPIYLTSPNGWRGVWVSGDVAETKGCAVHIHGARIEGHNTALPAHGSLLSVKGGQVSVRDTKVAWPMTNPGTDLAPIVVDGNADVSLDGLFYDQYTYTGPMVHVASGTCRVTLAKSITRQPMVVRNAGGTVTTDQSVSVS